MSNDNELAWFALAVRPKFEKAVARTLEMKSYETFLPLYRKHPAHGTWSRDTELPLFPGYVCCRLGMQHRLPVLTTPGVIRILGADSSPAALPEVEVASLQAAVRANCPVQPFPYIRTGSRVRIEQGALAGAEGIVLTFNQKLRMILSITLLQSSALLEIDRNQITESGLSYLASSTSPSGD